MRKNSATARRIDKRFICDIKSRDVLSAPLSRCEGRRKK